MKASPFAYVNSIVVGFLSRGQLKLVTACILNGNASNNKDAVIEDVERRMNVASLVGFVDDSLLSSMVRGPTAIDDNRVRHSFTVIFSRICSFSG